MCLSRRTASPPRSSGGGWAAASTRIWRELRAQGFAGGVDTVRRYVRRLKRQRLWASQKVPPANGCDVCRKLAQRVCRLDHGEERRRNSLLSKRICYRNSYPTGRRRMAFVAKSGLQREWLVSPPVMSRITPQGRLYRLTRREPLTSAESVAFLLYLGRRIGGKLLVIWDRSPIHRSALVKEFLAAGGAGYVHLEQFPPYAPGLNPDEHVWQHLKHVEMKNLCCRDLHHLSVELNLASNRLRKKSCLIQTFFAGAGLTP
jgi:transposase